MFLKRTLYRALLLSAVACWLPLKAQQRTVDSLKYLLRTARTDTAKVNLYNRIASQFASSRPDSSGAYALKAAALANKIDYAAGRADADINHGNAALVTGNYAAALAKFKQAEARFAQLLKGNPDNNLYKNGLARAYASAGVVYTHKTDHAQAIEKYLSALEIYRQTGQKANIAKALNNIGIIYKTQTDYSKALAYLKDALAFQRGANDPNQAMTLTNIGVVHFETRQYAKALDAYRQAEKSFQSNGDTAGYALLDNYLGDYYRSVKDFDLAVQHYRDALERYESIPNQFGASLTLYNLAQLYFERQQYALAMPLAQKSLDLAQGLGVLDQTYHSEKLLSALYEQTGDAVKSLAHYKRYVAARDSITNREHHKKFAQAEMAFEYKQKEMLLAEQNKRHTQLTVFAILATLLVIGLMLVIQNRRQVKRRLTLQKEVAEYEQKALHLQMNPHFVFNCLGAISSFIVQNGTDSALKYLSKFSKLMRLTLEYSKGSLIPIDKEIESLRNYLELEQLRFNNKFSFTLYATDKVEFNMGLPPLLIQPFVENAILHGLVPKNDDGHIAVNFDVQNSQLICTVTDNGIGLTQSRSIKQNSVTAHQSMALEITKKRLEIMESTTSKAAQIEIEELNANHQTGTRVTLRLPVQYIQ